MSEENIIAVINVDKLYDNSEFYFEFVETLTHKCQQIYKPRYENNDRIYFVYNSDLYLNNLYGLKLETIQKVVNTVDISNFFVVIKTSNLEIEKEIQAITDKISIDPVPVKFLIDRTQSFSRLYNKPKNKKVDFSKLNRKEKELLITNDAFCMYPWIHLHAYPTGNAYPCCMARMDFPVGSVKEHTISEIVNGADIKKLRLDMLAGKKSQICKGCYEQEKHGFFSGRLSANKHHGHHIHKVKDTNPDGSINNFEMIYWDIRFSNLCNLSCRSCGHIFSSSWYKDQIQLAGPDYAKTHKALQIAGRSETDMIDQLMEHIDYVEQIYFAGGEPLMMEEHYLILEELERREKFDVRLIYNTNFTNTKLKDREVFDYWRKFDSVSVGASLDAMGSRAEYIREGTNWEIVEENRRRMQEVCPNVDFYISATLSIMNVEHILDFHKDWVNRGFINAQDFNINILQDPMHYRIDIAPKEYKEYLTDLYQQHLDWLKNNDPLQRATNGFKSAIDFMNSKDNSDLIETFWTKTKQLDKIRNENIYTALPEVAKALS